MPPKKGSAPPPESSSEDDAMDGFPMMDMAKWSNKNAAKEFMAKLPVGVRRRVHALQALDADVEAVLAEHAKQQRAVHAEYLKALAPLHAKRRALVAGAAEPAAADVDAGCVQEHRDAGVSLTEDGPEVAAAGAAAAPAGKGLPGFWLAALSHHVVITEFIEERDRKALELVEDITCEMLDEPAVGFQVTFHFPAGNPFFAETQLTKTFKMKMEMGEETLDVAESTKISWKDGQNLTVELVTKKQKKKGGKGGKAEVRTVTKEEPCPSFFRFFLDDNEGGEQEEWMMLAQVLMTKIVPRAVDYYTGEAPDGESDLEDEDYGDDDDEEDEEEEDEGPVRGGGRGGRGGAVDMAAVMAAMQQAQGRGGRGGYAGGAGGAGGRGGGGGGGGGRGGRGGGGEECKQQ